METRDRLQIIDDIKDLVSQQGYIYTLCMILFEDNHVIAEELNSVNFRDRLNKNELSLLIGLLIQNEINYTPPEDPRILLILKKKTYSLLEELHWSLSSCIFDRMREVIKGDVKQSEMPELRELYSDDNMFTEPIFYTGDGAYDFQFLDFLKEKYKYDEEWLNENKNFYFDKSVGIVHRLRELAEKRLGNVDFFSLKEKGQEFKEIARSAFDGDDVDFEGEYSKYEGALEFFQYSSFFTDTIDDKFLPEEIYDQSWDSFYKNILELFIVRKSDFDESLDFSSFANNFSSIPQKGTNKAFKTVGDFNLFTACPLIKLDDTRFFFPITYSVYEAIYESPYYWMTNDKTYLDVLAKNRGETGEEITYNLLSRVFGVDKTFRSIRIEARKGFDSTDIDVLCVLGSKALCVQVKSKKLTQTTKQGSYKTLIKDFTGAVQDAYDQGIVCRDAIMANQAKFFDSDGKIFELPKGIDEVYIMGVTSENFPALTHQAQILLEKEESAPSAFFMSIFDLEVVCHYLNNPYDFLYYATKRIKLREVTNADNEIVYLSYHLQKKLELDEGMGQMAFDSSLGSDIDRDYYPYRMGYKTRDDNNRIKHRWRNADFEELCRCIANSGTPIATDIIFLLYEWDGDTRKDIVNQIRRCKQQTDVDGKHHDRTLISNEFKGSRSGLTFHSFNLNDLDYQIEKWKIHCKTRKYTSKADSWIGLASLPGSKQMVDMVMFNNQKWEYNSGDEKKAHQLLPQKPKYIWNKQGVKPQRNEPCPCGSGKKYKKCCGKNQ